MDFRPSTRIANIFYGDIFKILNKGYLVFGFGKSNVFKNIVSSEDDIISLDMACLTSDDKNLYGHFEMEMILGNTDPIDKRIKIDCLVRMLNKEETDVIYKNSKLQIKNISKDDFVAMSQFNIRYNQGNVGAITFDELIKCKDYLTCIIVPWFDEFEEKIKTLKEYFV